MTALAPIRINSMADYSPARLYLASFKWSDDGFTVEEAVAKYVEMHPNADVVAVRREIEQAAA